MKKYDEWFEVQMDLSRDAEAALNNISNTKAQDPCRLNLYDRMVIEIALKRMIPCKPVGKHTDYRCGKCGTRVRSGRGSSSLIKDTVCRNCLTVIDWRKNNETD